jgi:hypothetical protein
MGSFQHGVELAALAVLIICFFVLINDPGGDRYQRARLPKR